MEKRYNLENPDLCYPPGGLLIWLILIIEVLTFLGGITVFTYKRNLEPDLFHHSQLHLSPIVGTLNTLVLLTSGYFMALAVTFLKKGQESKSIKHVFLANVFGILFLIIKSSEYAMKLSLGFDLSHNTFFTLYWLITGFHFIHVLFGVGLLAYMQHSLKSKKSILEKKLEDLEATAVYWHMCDLIWILIFPVIYLF